MRLLHTSDWHLGEKLMGRDREEEHSLFLNWLLQLLKDKNIDTLIISGDIFDKSVPPNYALKLYYNFLSMAKKVDNLKNIIITAGNHDMSSSLNAPKELLKALEIDVITDGDNLEQEIITIERNNKISGIICATPFLREKILKNSFYDIDKNRGEVIRDGIKNHYEELLKKAKLITTSKPIIAMGHLTVNGAKLTPSSERDIYVGNLEGINSSIFGDFDYIALGHFHKFQKIQDNIFYSGSPIPLSFSESEEKKVILVDFDKNEKEFISIPLFRRLIIVSGTLEEIEKKFGEIQNNILKSWIEVSIKGDFTGEFINKKVREIAKNYNIDILTVKYNQNKQETREHLYTPPEELTPINVFKRKLNEENKENKEIFMEIFKEILREIES